MQRLYVSKIILNDIEQKSYVVDLPAVKYLIKNKLLEFNNPVTFFVGENGTGKSTLIEAIATACGFNPEGGSINFNFATKNTVSDLYKYITVAKNDYEKDGFFLRAESFYNVASQVDDLKISLSGYGGKSLHNQSHGESFMSLIQNRFRGKGLYILDEPEAALSPARQLTLLTEINRLVNDNSQFIIATHSPILLSYPNADIYETTPDGINQTEYEQCEHYRLTKQFLNDYKHVLKYLFENSK